jgi:hypothetical protein
MANQSKTSNGTRAGNRRAVYSLIVRGQDGQPRIEQFHNAASYKARLDGLPESETDSLTIDELVTLLDPER